MSIEERPTTVDIARIIAKPPGQFSEDELEQILALALEAARTAELIEADGKVCDAVYAVDNAFNQALAEAAAANPPVELLHRTEALLPGGGFWYTVLHSLRAEQSANRLGRRSNGGATIKSVSKTAGGTTRISTTSEHMNKRKAGNTDDAIGNGVEKEMSRGPTPMIKTITRHEAGETWHEVTRKRHQAKTGKSAQAVTKKKEAATTCQREPDEINVCTSVKSWKILPRA